MSSTKLAAGSHAADAPGGAPKPGPGRAGKRAGSVSHRPRRDKAQPRRVTTSAGRGSSPAPGHRLILACTGIVALGLLAVLFVNAVLSQGAFHQHELEIQLIYAAEKEESLARKVQVDEAPLTLERKAVEMGMVPAGSPVFLDLTTGKIKGEPVPAPSPTAPIVISADELTAPPERLSSKLMVPSSTSAPATSGEPSPMPASPAPGASSPGASAPAASASVTPTPAPPAVVTPAPVAPGVIPSPGGSGLSLPGEADPSWAATDATQSPAGSPAPSGGTQ